jgi:hypothetical protein
VPGLGRDHDISAPARNHVSEFLKDERVR